MSGGAHQGYFVPHEKPVDTGTGFAGLAADGARDMATALSPFSMKRPVRDVEEVAEDPDRVAAKAGVGEHPPFTRCERDFLTPLARSA